MTRFRALVKISFLSLLAAFKTPSRKRMQKGKGGLSAWGALAFIAAIALYISLIYSSMFAQMLKPYNQMELLLYFMALLAFFMSVLMTMWAAGGLVFGGKDSDLLLSLPVSAFEIMLSKLLALYLENLVLMTLMLLPAGVIYMTNTGFSVAFLLLLIVSTVLLTFASTFVSLLFGFIFTLISALFKRWAKIISTALYFLMFAGIMVVSFSYYTFVQQAIDFAAANGGLDGLLRSAGFLFAIFAKASFGSPLHLALLALISTVPLLLTVAAMSRGYKGLLTKLTGHAARRDYKLTSVSARSQFSALFNKEAGRYFGTSIYLFNTAFGLVIMLLASGYAVIKRAAVMDFLAKILIPDDYILPLAAAAMAFLAATACTTCVSISLEGKTLWILKESPVSARTVFLAKAALNVAVIFLPGAVSCALLALVFSFSFTDVLVLLLVLFSVACFVAFMGLVVNLMFPKLDAYNDTVVVKQSVAVLIMMFGGMLFVAALAAPYALALISVLPLKIYALLASALILALCFVIDRVLATKGAARLAQL